jgi:hypothetical protein
MFKRPLLVLKLVNDYSFENLPTVRRNKPGPTTGNDRVVDLISEIPHEKRAADTEQQRQQREKSTISGMLRECAFPNWKQADEMQHGDDTSG